MGRFRELEIPERAAGMRLDRFVARWFNTWSRTQLVRGIKDGQIRDEAGKPLRASLRLTAGQRIRLFIPGIAPDSDPPPLPPILHEDERVIALAKPSGLMAHPAGDRFVWSVVQVARDHWGPDVDLVHRLDRDTSGVILLTKDLAANRELKASLAEGRCVKVYDALVVGPVPWEQRRLSGRIGRAEGPIRIQMAVRGDGLAACTDVVVRAHRASLSWVECRIATGRTHQIRVHLADAGHAIVGDRLYGVSPDVFLRAWELGDADERTFEMAGARRHALHARRIEVPHPDGDSLVVEAPWPDDMSRWWDDPSVLPLG
jgi:23S rRNA pseudouridine1911/1915/1917 synthase